MKVLFKEGLISATTALLLTLSGCGGGGGGTTASSSSTSSSSDPTEIDYKFDRISIAGSSITYGNNYLGQESYVGVVEKYFREEIADTVMFDGSGLEVIEDNYAYQGKLYKVPAGTSINNFTIKGNEISIAFASSNVNTTVEMIVDGSSLGTYTILGNTGVKPVKTLDTATGFNFRENDPNAVKTWEIGGSNTETHTFTLKVTSGELWLNFVTSHMYLFQNAGIGGYAASTFLQTGTGTTTEEIVDFSPELFIFESATNDANTWFREEETGVSTNRWIVRDPVTCTASGNTITFSENVSVEAGDIVVKGAYNGSVSTLGVGVVAEASTANIITLTEPITSGLDEVCRVKNISDWEDNVESVIANVKTGVQNEGIDLVVGIATSGAPNYYDPMVYTEHQDYARRLMGYREKGEMLADQNGWMFFDFFGATLDFNNGVVENELSQANRWSKGDNTHPDINGYAVFGNAVVEVLKEEL